MNKINLMAAIALIAVATPSYAKEASHAVATSSLAAVQKAHFVDSKGIAIHGYDPVSYFDGTGKPGVAEFSSQYEGATYLFASAANKAKFDAKPASYVPQFGGYCAYGVAVGRKFHTVPETGTVVNGKLYFNKDKAVQTEWNKDIPALVTKGDANWPAVVARDIDG